MTKSEEYYKNNNYKVKGTKKCECCGEEFNVYITRDLTRKRFCSRECFGKVNSKEKGLIPPRPTKETYKKIAKTRSELIKAGKIKPPPKKQRVYLEKFCSICNKKLTYNNKSGLCRKHLTEHNQNNRTTETKIKQPKQQNKERYVCVHCEKEFRRWKSQIVSEKVFCSKDCVNKYPHPRKETTKLNLRKAIKRSPEYKKWQKSIYQQNQFTCVDCGSKTNIHAHHIKLFSVLLNEFLEKHKNLNEQNNKIELLKLAITETAFWETSNGITLCHDCHQKKHPNINLNKKT